MTVAARVHARATRMMGSRSMLALAQDRLARDGYVLRAELWADALYVASIAEAFAAPHPDEEA